MNQILTTAATATATPITVLTSEQIKANAAAFLASIDYAPKATATPVTATTNKEEENTKMTNNTNNNTTIATTDSNNTASTTANTTKTAITTTGTTMSNREAKDLKKRFAKLDKGSIGAETLGLTVTKKARAIMNKVDEDGNNLAVMFYEFKDKVMLFDALKEMRAVKEISDTVKAERNSQEKEITKAWNAFRFDDETEATLTAIANNKFEPDTKENFQLIKTLLGQLGLVADGNDALARVTFYITNMVTVCSPTILRGAKNDTTSRISFPEFHRQIVLMMLILTDNENESHKTVKRLDRLATENGILKEAIENKKAQDAQKEAEQKAKEAQKEAKKKEREEKKAQKTSKKAAPKKATPKKASTKKATNKKVAQ